MGQIGRGVIPLALLLLLTLFSTSSWAWMVVNDYNLTLISYNFPDFPNEDLKFDFAGYLLQVNITNDCHINVDKDRYRKLFEPDFDELKAQDDAFKKGDAKNLVAYVNWRDARTQNCRNALDVLVGRVEDGNNIGFANKSLPAFKAIIFSATSDLDTHFGAPYLREYQFYTEALPMAPYLILVARDDGDTLTASLETKYHEDPEMGLRIYAKKKSGVWNKLRSKTYFMFIHWFFFCLRVFNVLYVVYHLIRVALAKRIRDPFKPATHALMLVHLILLMVAPFEDTSTRGMVIVNILAWPFLSMAVYLVQIYWAHMMEPLHSWKWFRGYYWLSMVGQVLIGLAVLFSILSYIRMAAMPTMMDIATVFTTYLAPICLTIQSGITVAVGVWVIRNQWSLYNHEPSARTNVRLSIAVLCTTVGWLALGWTMATYSTVWNPVYRESYVAVIVAFNAGDIILTYFVLWSMAGVANTRRRALTSTHTQSTSQGNSVYQLGQSQPTFNQFESTLRSERASYDAGAIGKEKCFSIRDPSSSTKRGSMDDPAVLAPAGRQLLPSWIPLRVAKPKGAAGKS
ncbi:hypothetical protein H4R34_001079 [Dimargaris verticillata]|uniref:Uncharacterized protein n=1 Tax=Dimargaris verticillata TaxID=2761393 RepID=A0A9W8EB93_9FUNG|nr:hypothetical protein H4R34_001079 [Dimargaris verticillata]